MRVHFIRILFLATCLAWSVYASLGSLRAQSQPTVTYMPEATGQANHFALGHQGRWVVTSSSQGTARAWLDGELRHVFPGHHAAISPDGRWIVTGTARIAGNTGAVRIYDTETGKLEKTLESGKVRVLNISTDGSMILMGGFEGEVKVWALPKGELLHAWKTPGGSWMTSVSLSGDGRFIAASAVEGAWVWDRETSKRRSFSGHTSWVDRIVIGPSSEWVLTSSFDGNARVGDTRSGKLLAVLEHGERINSVALTPTGDLAVTGGLDGKGRVWRVPSGELVRTFAVGEQGVDDVAISPDGKHVAFGMARPSAAVFDLETGELLRRYQGQPFSKFVEFSADGTRLAVGYGPVVSLYSSTATGELQEEISAHRVEVGGLAFSADGRWLFASVYGRGTSVWDLRSENPPWRLRGLQAEWTGAGARLLVADTSSKGGWAGLWDVASQKNLGVFEQATPIVTAIAASDGSVVATAARNGEVALWNGLSGEALGVLSGPPTHPRRLVVSSKGRFVAVGNDGGNLVIWRDRKPTPWKVLQQESVERIEALKLSPDEKLLVSSQQNIDQISVWDLEAEAELRQIDKFSFRLRELDFFPGSRKLLLASPINAEANLWSLEERSHHLLKGHRDGITAISTGGGGRWLATGSQDRSVRLWDAVTLEEVGVFHGLLSQATAVAVDPAERFVAAGDEDGRVVVWDRESGRELIGLFALKRDAWAVVTPEGSWDAPQEGWVEGLVAWKDGASHFLGQLPDLRKPGLLSKTLAPWGRGKEIAAAPEPSMLGVLPLEEALEETAAKAPTELSFTRQWTLPVPGIKSDMAVRGDWAYVAAGEAGLFLVDLSNPEDSSLRLISEKNIRHLHWDGDFLYATGDDLYVFDVSNPKDPNFLWILEIPGFAEGVMGRGGYIHVAAGLNGLATFDLRKMDKPVGLSTYDTRSSLGAANDVVVAGRYAYVGEGGAGIPSGFEVIDVSKPARPRHRRSYETRHSVRDLTLSGDHLYLASGDGGLLIYDVENPRKATLASSFETSFLNTVRVLENKAFLATRTVMILDIADPTAPRLLGEYSPAVPTVQHVEPLPGDRLLVPLGRKGLELLRFSRTTPGTN